jgi:hypothetical protein
MKLKNINDLRNHALECLEKLANGDIDTQEAGVTGKLCEGVISTIKAELEYARMLGKEPKIPFMGDLSKNKSLLLSKPEKTVTFLPSPKNKVGNE